VYILALTMQHETENNQQRTMSESNLQGQNAIIG